MAKYQRNGGGISMAASRNDARWRRNGWRKCGISGENIRRSTWRKRKYGIESMWRWREIGSVAAAEAKSSMKI